MSQASGGHVILKMECARNGVSKVKSPLEAVEGTTTTTVEISSPRFSVSEPERKRVTGADALVAMCVRSILVTDSDFFPGLDFAPKTLTPSHRPTRQGFGPETLTRSRRPTRQGFGPETLTRSRRPTRQGASEEVGPSEAETTGLLEVATSNGRYETKQTDDRHWAVSKKRPPQYHTKLNLDSAEGAVAMPGGGFKMKRPDSRGWDYFCQHGRRHQRCQACKPQACIPQASNPKHKSEHNPACENIPLSHGGFKKRRVNGPGWDYFCKHGSSKYKCRACAKLRKNKYTPKTNDVVTDDNDNGDNNIDDNDADRETGEEYVEAASPFQDAGSPFHEQKPLANGGFKRRPIGSRYWAYFCRHGRQSGKCKPCGGVSLCKHDRQRRYCKDCGGSTICKHGRQKFRCKDCGGSQICQHGRIRYRCKQCNPNFVPST